MEPSDVRLLTDAETPACEAILRSLPDWFGLEDAIAEYARDIRSLKTFGAWQDEELVGFITLKQHFEHAAEVRVMAVPAALHRHGIGRTLLTHAERWLRERGTRWTQVKTLGPSRVDEPYERTRAFYRSSGYEPLEELQTLWGRDNPCLLMVKRL